MKINWKLAVLFTGAIACSASPVLANAGTPLMWTAFQHLFLGNALIGLIESFVLSSWFKIPSSVGVITAANYVSAWVGAILVVDRFSKIPNITLENAGIWLWIFVAITFWISIVVEYPFFWFALREQKQSAQKAIKATLVIHGLSYFLLLIWYAQSSQISLLTQLDVVSAEQVQPTEEYVLYYLSPDGTQVVRSDLDGTNREIVKESINSRQYHKLEARQDDAGQFDLLTDSDIILSDFAILAPTGYREFGAVSKLIETTNWNYETSVWAAGGIRGYNKQEDLGFHWAIEIPFAVWRIFNGTHLEGDFVVFQLGKDQICILQPQEEKIALIARGKEPLVASPKLPR